MNPKTLIIAAIALIIIIFGAIMLTQDSTAPAENVTAYDVPLKSADFDYFEISAPENSNFTIKNAFNETSKGMVYWKNTGNFSKEVEGIIIDKNLTDQLIHENMNLLTNDSTTKVYESNGLYQIVKTQNDTDIILIGSDLHVLNEMITSAKIKDTKNLTSPKKVEETPLEKAVDKNKQTKNTTKPKQTAKKVETTTEKKTESKKPKVETTNEKKVEKPKVETTSEKKTESKKVETTSEKKATSGQIYIGGGIFKTGSSLDAKTNAKIYIDGGNPGESVIIKIKYYRDGNSLNKGNLVTKTIGKDGYIDINSADSYKYYPDKAYIELYDLDGKLQSTQTVTLNPDSSTQYF